MNSWLDIKEKIKKAPKAPGVYIFRNRRGVLYIGKASNLKNRLQSYLKSGDFKNDRLQENTTGLKLIILRSEIEALIEEAKLIKRHRPPYNVIWRDDKSYFYAAFMKPFDKAQGKEKFPRIFVAHKSETLNPKPYTLNPVFIGPFTEGRALRLVLKMLRRRFPYCTCPKPHLRDCLNAQIGNCFGFCCKKDAAATNTQIAKYKKDIRIIKNFLLGKPLKGFTKNLKPEEKSALEKILAHREFLDFTQMNADSNADKRGSDIGANPRKSAVLIEGYDISHLSGKETVAGMTAWSFAGGKLLPRKDFWRKFIIRTAEPGDDPAAMLEAVSRRLNHVEWPYPKFIIIDGGKAQLSAAKLSLSKSGVKNIKAISFAKPEQLVYGLKETPSALSDAPAALQKIIPAVISKTHDFAVKFHRVRRKRAFLSGA